MRGHSGVCRKAFLAAFPYTIPILTGFLFLGIAYGIYMNVSGFSPIYPILMSMAICGFHGVCDCGFAVGDVSSDERADTGAHGQCPPSVLWDIHAGQI